MAAKSKKEDERIDFDAHQKWAERMLADQDFQDAELAEVAKQAELIAEMPLTEKQRAFVGNVVFNPRMSYRTAARLAGYSEAMGQKLMARADVQAHIEHENVLNRVGRVLLLEALREGQSHD